MSRLKRKDYILAFIVGLITSVFLVATLWATDISLSYGKFSLPLWSLLLIVPIGEYIAYVVASYFTSGGTFLRQFGRYVIVGIMNFAVYIGTVAVLQVWTGVAAESVFMIGLLIIGEAIAITHSYFWQRIWTFAQETAANTKEFASFVGITIVGALINIGVAYILILIFAPFEFTTDERLVVVANICAVVVSVIWNFLGYRFVVFKKSPEISTPQ